MAEETREEHLARLKELSEAQRGRELTADELREVARRFRAVGDEECARQAAARAKALTEAEAPAALSPVFSAGPAARTPARETPTAPPPRPRPLPPQPERTSGMAIAAVVLFGLAFLTGGLLAPLGILVGIIALVRIGRSQGRLGGQALAITGLAGSCACLLLLFVTAAILFPVFAKAREKARQASCQSNLKQIGLGLMQYDSAKGHLPPAGSDLATELDPYVRAPGVFNCPSGGRYMLNPAVAGKSTEKIARPAETLMVMETDDGKTVAKHHNGGANYGFVDGHVKWSIEAPIPSRGASPSPFPPGVPVIEVY